MNLQERRQLNQLAEKVKELREAQQAIFNLAQGPPTAVQRCKQLEREVDEELQNILEPKHHDLFTNQDVEE